MKSFEKFSDLGPLVGETVATSEWLLVDQNRVNLFAEATGDSQWIHVDVERARSGPFGGTIAHGFMTLSLFPAFFATAIEIRETRTGLNYGLDKVRFVAPVPVGRRLRGHFKLMSLSELDGGGAQLKFEMTVECEGSSKPACVAEAILRLFP